MKKYLIGAAVIGALAFSAAGASAAVVCNGEGDCWHTKQKYDYHPDWGVTVYDDNWTWPEGGNYRWREHEGRGYWNKGVWIGF